MPSMQINVSEELNKKIEIFKAMNNCTDKRDAVIKMLESIDFDYSTKKKTKKAK